MCTNIGVIVISVKNALINLVHDLDLWPFNTKTTSLLGYSKVIPGLYHFGIIRFLALCCGQTDKQTNWTFYPRPPTLWMRSEATLGRSQTDSLWGSWSEGAPKIKTKYKEVWSGKTSLNLLLLLLLLLLFITLSIISDECDVSAVNAVGY